MEQQKTAKRKTYRYPVSASWQEEGKAMSYMTQLYQTGIYIIFNNDSSMQGTMLPQGMVKLAKKLRKGEETGKIININFGREISVSNASGFLEEA
jgi:hypothetical protein